jgi:hypothetical protein
MIKQILIHIYVTNLTNENLKTMDGINGVK